MIRIRSHLLLAMVVFAATSATAIADDPDPDGVTPETRERSTPSGKVGEGLEPTKPFSARVVVDSRSPITYGDSVLVSVWITPLEGWDLRHVRIHAKGDLVSIYRTSEDVVDPFDEERTTVEGSSCRADSLSKQKGVPFAAVCRLTPLKSGWRRWFDWNSFLGASKQQFEIEIAVAEEIQGTSTYYEFGTVDFTSHKSTVIIGGFFGALLWAVFLAISVPRSAHNDVAISSWSNLLYRVRDLSPRALVIFARGGTNLFRSALLGGSTAMVLIVMASASSGYDPPIVVRIQDFWGGVMVGILSVPLAKWIRQKLGKDFE